MAKNGVVDVVRKKPCMVSCHPDASERNAMARIKVVNKVQPTSLLLNAFVFDFITVSSIASSDKRSEYGEYI